MARHTRNVCIFTFHFERNDWWMWFFYAIFQSSCLLTFSSGAEECLLVNCSLVITNRNGYQWRCFECVGKGQFGILWRGLYFFDWKCCTCKCWRYKISGKNKEKDWKLGYTRWSQQLNSVGASPKLRGKNLCSNKQTGTDGILLNQARKTVF
jgi:hypothetical protein